MNSNLFTMRNKFLVILLPLFILSFTILALISYYITQNILLKSADVTASKIGEKYAAEIRTEMSNRMIRLEELSSDPELLASDQAGKIKILKALKQRTTEFDMICFVDKNGIAVNEDGLVMNRADREYIKKVRETQKPYLSDPSISHTTGKAITLLTLPILKNGQLEGFVCGTISLDKISKLTDEIKFFDSGYGYLVDESGMTIGFGKKPEYVGNWNVTEKTLSAVPGHEKESMPDNFVDGFKNALTNKQQGVLHYATSNGTESLAVITPINLEGRSWFVSIVAPEAEVNADAAKLSRTLGFTALFFTILAIAIIYFFASRIAKSVEQIRDECQVLTEGDFRQDNVSIDSRDEIGQLAAGFNKMRETLRNLIRQIQSQSNQVAASSEELTANSTESAQASSQVAASIAVIADGLERQTTETGSVNKIAQNISANAEEISAKASEVAGIAKSTNHHATEGRSSIALAVTQMKKIDEGSKNIYKAIENLNDGSQEISNIVDLISNIAGQTNLLALNAAIEAARAGEHGRGFSVVAEEVRKLAEESEKSSTKIGELIGRNLNDMQLAVNAMKTESDQVNSGIEAIEQADQTFAQIADEIINLSHEIENISSAITHMANDSTHMVKSIAQIDDISTKNAAETQSVSATTEEQAASIQEIASASQGLADLAMQLQNAIEKFKI